MHIDLKAVNLIDATAFAEYEVSFNYVSMSLFYNISDKFISFIIFFDVSSKIYITIDGHVFNSYLTGCHRLSVKEL